MDSSKGVFILEFDWKSWFLDVWEENRRLTNFVVRDLDAAEAMDKQPVNGMRPFREMLFEIWGIENAYLRGLALDQWKWEGIPDELRTAPIQEALAYGQHVREQTRKLWPSISMESLTIMRSEPFWGGPDGTAMSWLTYALENEIHHRGQGYVYLRLLGKEPPAFFVRTDVAE
ncbi:hypothetical protein B2M26_12630 [Ferroacidibacillus organovorans]|uniref:Damage-inducible protein DinB n=1 Tax=Ferroacidibacillus organovorans TaxID=1765683 RepID=A0A1V4ERC9_9BACL|nr:hypothetical protein B2M26_12630 [Ferroacidibacillus organovorans]